MLDSVLVANEIVEDLRRCRRRGLCLKVNYEKAWIEWVRGCLESTTMSVLVNGSPTKEFTPTRGLSQEDPLAPFLFIIVVEGLAGLVRQAIKSNMLGGVKVGRNEVESCVL
ncbi:uncharacterized mitochondrial protein AtMg01250-like [Phaseolus vulgaris]|uniref:uncharacterized mitochondrial protein AtMg01250-like n=1 Tax=Phaseolus vulgaris TaxID=3885 RepID=UPI0035CA63C8